MIVGMLMLSYGNSIDLKPTETWPRPKQVVNGRCFPGRNWDRNGGVGAHGGIRTQF